MPNMSILIIHLETIKMAIKWVFGLTVRQTWVSTSLLSDPLFPHCNGGGGVQGGEVLWWCFGSLGIRVTSDPVFQLKKTLGNFLSLVYG